MTFKILSDIKKIKVTSISLFSGLLLCSSYVNIFSEVLKVIYPKEFDTVWEDFSYG